MTNCNSFSNKYQKMIHALHVTYTKRAMNIGVDLYLVFIDYTKAFERVQYFKPSHYR